VSVLDLPTGNLAIAYRRDRERTTRADSRMRIGEFAGGRSFR